MAKIFLDTNIFIDLVEGRGNKDTAQDLDGQKIYISQFEVVNLTKNIHNNSLDGPIPDLEDNIKLHSATETDCDYFLTNDEKLLKMKFFGKAKIVDKITSQNHL